MAPRGEKEWHDLDMVETLGNQLIDDRAELGGHQLKKRKLEAPVGSLRSALNQQGIEWLAPAWRAGAMAKKDGSRWHGR